MFSFRFLFTGLTLFLVAAAVAAGTRGPAVVVPDEKPIEDDAQEKPLNFDVQYVYRTGGEGELKTLRDGSVLQSGDFYKIQFTPEEKAYVYIFQVDSSGSVFSLFPGDLFGDVVLNNKNPVEPETDYIIPAADMSFQLDRQTGEETIYFFAFRYPNPMLKRIAENLNVGLRTEDKALTASVQAEFSSTVKTRGPAKIVSDHNRKTEVRWDDNDKFEMPAQRLEGLCKKCVSKVTFLHR